MDTDRHFEKILASIETKAEGDGRRLSVGLMTVGSKDTDNEIVDQATALRAMPAFIRAGGPCLFNHDRGGAPGRCIDYTGLRKSGEPTMNAEETYAIQVTTEYGKGYTFATLFYGPQRVDDIWAQLIQKMLPAHSIAFRGYTAGSALGDTDDEGAVRIFVRRILEYSVLTVPAHEEATVAAQLMKMAGLHECTSCKQQLAVKIEDWSRRLPNAQGRELIDRARELASASSPTLEPAMLDLA